jgi:hypothetical protein
MTAGEACPVSRHFAVIPFWSAAIEHPTRVECYRQSHYQFGESASFRPVLSFDEEQDALHRVRVAVLAVAMIFFLAGIGI